jgi:hypothetical protein
MTPQWEHEMANICEAINNLRSTIASEYRNSGGARAIEYTTEAKSLIEVAYDVLRREDRWAKKEAAQWTRHGTLN